MVRIITQETFDEVVKENIDEFSMSPEEATDDAVQQFEAQGVDLSNIVKNLIIDSLSDGNNQSVVDVLSNIDKLLKTNSASPELKQELVHLKESCDESLGHRILATKHGAYLQLITILKSFEKDRDMIHPALDAITSLMTGNPDPLESKGIELIIHFLDSDMDVDTQQKVLRWSRQCCIKHEKNRQDIYSSPIKDRLKTLLINPDTSAPLIRDVCALMKALVLDDDVRVEFGNAHVHALGFAEASLLTIISMLKRFQDDKDTLSDVLSTLAVIMVKNEYCEKVEETGGLKYVMDVMVNFLNSEKLNCQCFKLLKALAGNDKVKSDIVKAGAAPLIISAMNRHMSSNYIACFGSAVIAALSLRSPGNSQALCEAGASETIVQAMRVHQSDGDVQKQCCWAIRNIVSRDRSLCPQFLSLEVEALLQNVLKNHSEKCDHDARAALRDLGCDVEFRELWTGKGGLLNHS